MVFCKALPEGVSDEQLCAVGVDKVTHLIYVKMTLTQFLAEIHFIANDGSINPSNLSKMLVKKQMKYFDVPLDHAWKVPVSQDLLNTRTNNLYVEGFNDYVMK